jgi:hypothetical protein
MRGGVITENTTINGGAVYVDTNGIFIMKGGDISGNTALTGGGVYVSSGTFKKVPGVGGLNSGIIYGFEVSGNDINGVPLKNTTTGGSEGHAVYSLLNKRNITAEQMDDIDTSTGLGLSASGNAPFGQ